MLVRVLFNAFKLNRVILCQHIFIVTQSDFRQNILVILPIIKYLCIFLLLAENKGMLYIYTVASV